MVGNESHASSWLRRRCVASGVAAGLCLFLSACMAQGPQAVTASPTPSPAAVRAGDVLTYVTKDGVKSVVTADGLSSIFLGDREVAKGAWRAGSGEAWFKYGEGKVKGDGKVTQKSIAILSDSHARVRHVCEELTTVYDYVFAGEDVTITARVENNNPDADLAIIRFSGLTFTFASPPVGLMSTQHISYFQAHGVGMCHPGGFSRIGGSYATDDPAYRGDRFGMGVSPSRTGLVRTLILWDYADWSADKQAKDPRRLLNYFVVSPVPKGGAATFEMKLRLSTNLDWKHLLEPYKEHFQATFGPVQYKADHRWVASAYANKSVEAMTPQNPYGFHDGSRLDLPEIVNKVCDDLLKQFRDGGGQGVLFWGQGGEEPRGAMYRPDFDILPPEVAAQWPLMEARFKEASVHLGVTARPRHMAVRLDWKSDQIIDINPDDNGHRDMLWHRFANMIGKGCTLFYLDSFGTSLEDVKLMRFLRDKMGPAIQTFAEHQSDAIIPYSGGYSETVLTGTPDGSSASYNFWSGLQNWEIYRWLCPGAQMVSRIFQVKDKVPKDFEPAEKFWYSHHITPLLPNARGMIPMPELKVLQDQYLDDKGQWKVE